MSTKNDTPSIDAIKSPPLGYGYIRREAAERVELELRNQIAELTRDKDRIDLIDLHWEHFRWIFTGDYSAGRLREEIDGWKERIE